MAKSKKGLLQLLPGRREKTSMYIINLSLLGETCLPVGRGLERAFISPQ